jgi:hypothetical protein
VRARALLAFASLALCVAIGEVAVRAFDLGPTVQVVFQEVFQPSAHPGLAYELRPGARDGEDVISSAGLRDREYSEAHPAHTFRVAAIGDSVTYGLGVKRQASWPAVLEDLLTATAAPGAGHFEVLNLGVTGYNLAEVVEALRARGLRFEPDLIVYGYVLNDPQAFSLEAEALERLTEREQRSALARGGARLLARSRLVLLARHLLSEPDEPRSYRFDERGRIYVEGEAAPVDVELRADPGVEAARRGDREGRYFRDLYADAEARARLARGLAELARVAGAVPVALAIFPIFPKNADAYPVADLHRVVAAEARSAGLSVIDLLPAYEAAAARFGPERAALDILHPSPFGHIVAGVALLQGLADARLLPDSVDPRLLRRQRSLAGAVAGAVGPAARPRVR